MRLHRWRFFESVYMAQFVIFRGPYAAFLKEMKRCYGYQEDGNRPPPSGKCIEHTHDNGARHYVLWVPETWRAQAADSMNVLAHEVMHLTLFVLMTRGVDATKDNHEHYCYLHGWIFEQCWKRLRAA